MEEEMSVEKALYLNEKGMSVVYDADHNIWHIEGEE